MKKVLLSIVLICLLLITTSCNVTHKVTLYMVNSTNPYFEPICKLEITKKHSEKLTNDDYKNLCSEYLKIIYSETKLQQNESLGTPLKVFNSSLLLEEVDPYPEITSNITLYAYCNTILHLLGSDYGFNGWIYYTYDKSLYEASIPDNINILFNQSLSTNRLSKSFKDEYITFDQLYSFVCKYVLSYGISQNLKKQNYDYSKKENVSFIVNEEVITFPFKLPQENIVIYVQYSTPTE